MSKPEQEKEKHEQVVMDPRLLAAMYGMREEDEIDLLEYWRVIWKNRVLILVIALVVGALAVQRSLSIPNTFKAEILLVPTSYEGGNKMVGLPTGFGGFSSLAGGNMAAGGNVEKNLAVLKSREFLWAFIKKEKMMPILFADNWDTEAKAWKEHNPEKQPSFWAGYRVLSGIMSVDTDNKSGLVTVGVEWTDAALAAKWANELVARLNAHLRQKAISQSYSTLKYLNEELRRTQVEDQRKALFELISQGQKKAMLANTRKQFAFQVLDKAVIPDKKFKPNRARTVMLSLLVAGFLTVIFIFIRESIQKRSRKEEG